MKDPLLRHALFRAVRTGMAPGWKRSSSAERGTFNHLAFGVDIKDEAIDAAIDRAGVASVGEASAVMRAASGVRAPFVTPPWLQA